MMRKLLLNFILALGLMQTISSLQAQEAQLIRPDNEVEAQVQRLSEELRCLVCQNQTIADSHAGLAEDLKKEEKTEVQSDKEKVKNWMNCVNSLVKVGYSIDKDKMTVQELSFIIKYEKDQIQKNGR